MTKEDIDKLSIHVEHLEGGYVTVSVYYGNELIKKVTK